MEKLGIEIKGDSQDQEEDASTETKVNLASILTERKGRHDNEKAQVDGPSKNESILAVEKLSWQEKTSHECGWHQSIHGTGSCTWRSVRWAL